MRRIIASVLLLTCGTASANARDVERAIYVSTKGVSYIWNTTPQGVVFVAPNTATDDLYLLTPHCVVQNQTHGTGSWGHDEGGWQISFGLRYEIFFPGQTPPFNAPDCLMLR